MSLDLFQVSKINKIVVKKPDSKIKLKYLRDTEIDIECDELTLEAKEEFKKENIKLNIKKLNLLNTGFNDSDDLSPVIQNSKNLTSLNFLNCFNMNLDIKIIEELKTLESLKFTNCDFIKEQGKQQELDLYKLCENNASLKTIVLFESDLIVNLEDIFKIAEIPLVESDRGTEDKQGRVDSINVQGDEVVTEGEEDKGGEDRRGGDEVIMN